MSIQLQSAWALAQKQAAADAAAASGGGAAPADGSAHVEPRVGSPLTTSGPSHLLQPTPPSSLHVRPEDLPSPAPASPLRSSSPAPSTLSAAASSWRRKAQVAQFIRAGESNTMFREKAPSIVPNQTGLFLPPSARAAAARAAEAAALAAAKKQEGRAPQNAGGLERNPNSLSIPLLAAVAGAEPQPHFFIPTSVSTSGRHTPNSGGPTSPQLRPFNNQPTLSSSAPRFASSPASGLRGVPQPQQPLSGRAGRRSSGAGLGGAGGAGGASGTYTPPMINRSASPQPDSRASSGAASPMPGTGYRDSSDDDSSNASSRRASRKFSFMGLFGSGTAAAGSGPGGLNRTSSDRAASPSPMGRKGSSAAGAAPGAGPLVIGPRPASPALLRAGSISGRIARDRRFGSMGGAPIAGLGGPGAQAAGPSPSPAPGVDEVHAFEEARRKAEAREANLIAPFLEARGAEDFVTYDLTRQQDYHKQRKELARLKFAREKKARGARSAKKKRKQKQAAQAAKELDMNEADLPLASAQRRKNKPAPAAPGGAPPDDSSSSSDEYASDASADDELDNFDNAEDRAEWALASRPRRCWIRLRETRVVRTLNKMFYLGQGWLICGMIGAITGLLAALVDLAVQWLIDLKSGYCHDTLYLSNSFCCAGSTQWVGGSGEQPLLLMCPEWTNWDQNPGVSGTLSILVSPFFAAYLMYVLLGIAMACLGAWLVLYYAPHAAGSGIPEIKTILGGVVVKKYLGGWTLLIKCMATCLAVGAGLSIGKEGAYVHVACCVANILCRYFPEFKNNQYKKNEAISAASAAGISVAFGAPVGGVLFSLEEVASYFPHKTMWRAFFCALIASIVLQSIDPYQEGRLTLFQITYSKTWMWFEMFPFALLGIIGGLLGAAFIRLNTFIAQWRRKSFLRHHPILEVAAVALFTVVIKYLSAYMRGNQNAVLASLFGDCHEAPFYDPLGMCDVSTTAETIAALMLTSVATFFLTTFTWSLCVPGGIFIPALMIGACNGRMVGTLMRSWQSMENAPSLLANSNPFTPGIYALVGAAAMLGGVTRMTVCLVVIMFELTGGLSYLLPIMMGLIFSKVVGDAFDRRSIFDAHLATMNYPFLHSKERIPPGIRVRDAMSRDLLALPMHGHSIESLKDQLALLTELKITGFPIVTTLQDRLIVGYINRSELYTALAIALRDPLNTPQTRCYFAMLSLRFPRNEPYVDLRPWLHPSPIQVVEHTPLYRVHDLFKKMGLRSEQRAT